MRKAGGGQVLACPADPGSGSSPCPPVVSAALEDARSLIDAVETGGGVSNGSLDVSQRLGVSAACTQQMTAQKEGPHKSRGDLCKGGRVRVLQEGPVGGESGHEAIQQLEGHTHDGVDAQIRGVLHIDRATAGVSGVREAREHGDVIVQVGFPTAQALLQEYVQLSAQLRALQQP